MPLPTRTALTAWSLGALLVAMHGKDWKGPNAQLPSARGWEALTSSLPLVISTVCSGLLHPLSHPVRYVAVEQVEPFLRAGFSATSSSAQRPHQGAAAQRGSASPAPPPWSHLRAWRQRVQLPKTPAWDTSVASYTLSRPPYNLPAPSSGLSRFVVSFCVV